jgi:hypothetical protein
VRINDKYEKARDLFIENRGSRDLMLDNKCLEEYEQLKIPKEMECVWKDEFIKDRFIKASSQGIKVIDLICGVCLIAGYYGNYSDYQRILSIKDLYLKDSDMFEYIMFFDKVLDSIRILIRNNDMPNESKLKIVCKFEAMLNETISKKVSVPDKTFNTITCKYGIEPKKNFLNNKLNKIINEVKGIKMELSNFAKHF